MKKIARIIGVIVLILFVSLFALLACLGEEEPTELTQEQIEEIENSENAEVYKGMIKNLDSAFSEKTEKLISEFETESVHVLGDEEALKELGESKVDELIGMYNNNAEILEKQITDRGDSEEAVEYWCGKLEDIAKEYSFMIMELYD